MTGDYLLVSKLSYGPRIPQTPLTMPLTQHNLPVWLGGGKSYVEWPKWDYRRVKGFGQVKPGDIVVFNYLRAIRWPTTFKRRIITNWSTPPAHRRSA